MLTPSTQSRVVAGLMSTHGVLLGGHRSFLLPFVLDWDGCQDHTESREKLPFPGSPHDASHISRKKEKVTAGDRYAVIWSGEMTFWISWSYALFS